MCGIVGYIGTKDAEDLLLTGLKRLEYRGYDSAGLAMVNSSGLHVQKQEGKVDDLRNSINGSPIACGRCRSFPPWASR